MSASVQAGNLIGPGGKPGSVDGCDISYASASDTASILTPENTALLEASKAKIGLNPQTPGVLTGYFNLLAIKWAVEKANSLDGTKLAAAQLREQRPDEYRA